MTEEEKAKERAMNFDYIAYAEEHGFYDEDKMSEKGKEIFEKLDAGDMTFAAARSKYQDEDWCTKDDVRAWYNVSFDRKSLLPEDIDYLPWTGALRCTAQAKVTGRRCMQPASKGYTVCRKHGAGSKEKPGGVPIYKRDIYHLQKNTDLSSKAERFLNDERLDQLDGDIAQLMALYEVAAEDAGEGGINFRALSDLLDKVGKMKKRKADIENQSAFSMKEFQMLMNGMKNLIERHVEPKNQKAFVTDLRELMQIANKS